ncbi:MAG TPA: Holliday junction branch migration protein RuvA, partial [Spirochaetia bacterium]|nr:Holliday junction branch migration protein RuvA [Spirochaetia bacterium]
HYHHTDSEASLYGFADEKEKYVFRLLISVSGIGPKMAMKILAGAPVNRIVQAVNENNPDLLGRIPGLGAKTAQKMILELQGKLAFFISSESGVSSLPADSVFYDARDALRNLGYREQDITKTLTALKNEKPGLSIEALIRESLAKLSKV